MVRAFYRVQHTPTFFATRETSSSMGISNWFKGKRGAAEKVRPAIVRPEEFIVVYDERGRELKITRADWVTSVLAPALEKAWNDPKELSAQIVQALRDDFVAQVADAAERLVEVDQESEDALVIAGVVKMEMGDLDGAERALQQSISKRGPSGLVLTNLAKVLERRGQVAESRATLGRALHLDPNQDNGLLWWAAIAREEKGDAGYVSALAEIASLPGAWRPQLWLAREKLKQGDRETALSLYDVVLARAANVPDVLMMVTGDLGNAGALEDLVRIGVPLYKPEVHGPHAGMNLVQACKELGRIDDARSLIRQLQAMRWAPLAAQLAALETEIVAASLPKQDDGVPEVGAITFDGPLWTRGWSEPDWLLPSRTDADPFVALFTFANETLKDDAARLQMADEQGRLTRALPLYLAEALRLRFRLRTRASIFVVKNQGPAVFGKPLARETLEGSLPPSLGRRIAVTGSLVAGGIRLEVWEVGAVETPTTVSVEASLTDVSRLVINVERLLVGALKERGLLSDARAPSWYSSPPQDLLPAYIAALEQLLAQLLVANDVMRADSLWNERGYFETYFGLVDAWQNVPESARLIAICGTAAAAKYKSAFVEPYRRIALKWVDEAPPRGALCQLAPAIFRRLEDGERYSRWMQQAPALSDASYMAWLERVKIES
jgi:tetratricopeptide (TPR) repeat protein